MFNELTIALEKLIKDPVKGLTAVAEVTFDRPSDEPAKLPGVITVNAFLYDVREDTDLRSNELSFKPGKAGLSVARAHFYVTCSYLITVWVQPVSAKADSLKEQELLGQLMQLIASQAAIAVPRPGPPPRDPLLIPAYIATVDEKGSLSEFWTALGNKIRPSFVLKATVPLEPSYVGDTPLQAATSHSVGIGLDPTPQSILDRDYVIKKELQPGLDRWHTIGGQVANDKGVPQQNVKVTIVELHRQTETDLKGRYVFANVPDGTYTISVSPIQGVTPTERQVDLRTWLKTKQSYDFGAPIPV